MRRDGSLKPEMILKRVPHNCLLIAEALFLILIFLGFFISKTFAAAVTVLGFLVCAAALNMYARLAERLSMAEEIAGIMTETAGGCYWEWNSASQKLRFIPDETSLFGKRVSTREEFLAVLHPDDAFTLGKNIAELFAAGPGNADKADKNDVEFRVQSLQGDWKWFVMRRGRAVRSSGNSVKIVGAMMDVDAFKRAVESARSSKARLDTIFNNAPGSMAVTDTGGNLAEANQAFYDMLGYSAEDLLGVPIMSLAEAERGEKGGALMAKLLKECEQSGDRLFRLEEIFVSSGGERLIVNYGLSAIYDFDGNVQNYIFSGADITLQVKHAEELNLITQQLQELHTLIHSLLLTQNRDHLLDGMLGHLKSVVPNSACAVYLYNDGMSDNAERLERLAWYEEEGASVPDSAVALSSARAKKHFVERGGDGMVSRHVAPIVFQSRAIGVVDVSKPLGMFPQELKMYQLLMDYVSSFWVLYDLMAAREEEASVDPLTGIWNRRYMLRRFQEESDRIARYNGNACVVLGDMGNFKQINDRYGHAKGDEVLIKVARVLKKCLRVSDSVGRYGGDEFLMLLPNISKEAAELVIERVTIELGLLRVTGEDENGKETAIQVILDFGVAPFPGQAPTLLDTIDAADEEMFANKIARKTRLGLPTTREGAESA